MGDVSPAFATIEEFAGAIISDDKKSKLFGIRTGKYVCLEGEGLVILGCIGNELLTYAPEDWRKYASKPGQINWQESDAIWTSSIRQRRDQIDPKTNQPVTTYKKLSAYSAVTTAIDNVRKAIGWCRPDPLDAGLPSTGETLELEDTDAEVEAPAIKAGVEEAQAVSPPE
ncbi:MAG: hypothetical protein ACLQU1_30535 [Bryobacteraceae bacterium]